MKKFVYYFASWMLILTTLLTGTACKPNTPIISLDPNLPSTMVVPQPGDMIKQSMGQLAAMSLNSVISESEKVFIGTVQEILPSQQGIYRETGEKIVYKDVLIIPERYLFVA